MAERHRQVDGRAAVIYSSRNPPDTAGAALSASTLQRAWPRDSPPEPDLFRERRALSCIVGRDHWIVGGQIPLCSVCVRREAVPRAQIAFEHRELFAVFEADEVIGADGLFDRHSGLWRGRVGDRRGGQAGNGSVNAADDYRHFIRREAVLAQISRNNHARVSQLCWRAGARRRFFQGPSVLP